MSSEVGERNAFMAGVAWKKVEDGLPPIPGRFLFKIRKTGEVVKQVYIPRLETRRIFRKHFSEWRDIVDGD